MPALTEELLKDKIKKDPMGAYLIFGEESFLVKTYTDRLMELTVDESFADFNLKIFDGDEISLSDVYDSVTAVPMMAPSKCVVVRDYPIDSASESEIRTIEMIVGDNPEDNCLVFSFAASNPKKIKNIEKIFSDKGFVVNFSRKTKSDLVKIVESGARKREKIFEIGAADYLVTCVGEDLTLLGNELEKVCAYAEGMSVTKADIDAVCVKNLETKVFDMVKDLTSGRFDPAFRKLNGLFSRREDEYMILGALISQYTDMYRAKTLKNSGESFDMMGQVYSTYKGKSFKLENAARISASMSSASLRECLEVLAKADMALKSTSADKKQVLERTVVSLARAGR